MSRGHAEAVVRFKAGKEPEEFRTMALAAEASGLSAVSIAHLVETGKISRRTGYRFMRLCEYRHPEGLPAVSLAPQSIPAPPEVHGPILEGLKGGMSNTPEMLAFINGCREELTERIPAREYRMKVRRELDRERNKLTVMVSILLYDVNTSNRDREYIRSKGWEDTPIQLVEKPRKGERLVAFIKSRTFNVEGLRAFHEIP